VVNGVKRCTEFEGNDDGGFARRGEYCLKCEEWMFRWKDQIYDQCYNNTTARSQGQADQRMLPPKHACTHAQRDNQIT